ncbi:MAG: hypothetical protein WCP79_04435 [Bacillota bacterium]
MKKTITTLFIALMLFSTPIFAEPLYDYRLGQFTVDVGWWSGISEVAISTIPNKGGLNYAVSNAGNISADAYVGLSHGFAARLAYTDLGNTYKTPWGQVNIQGNIQEYCLLFKVANSIPQLINNAGSLFTGNPIEWSPEPEGRDVYSVMLGYTRAGNLSSSGPEQPVSGQGFNIGIVSTKGFGKHINTYSFVSICSNASLNLQAGICYHIIPDLTVDVGYKCYNLNVLGNPGNNDTSYLYKSGFLYNLSFHY